MKSRVLRLKVWYEHDPSVRDADVLLAALEREVAEALARGTRRGQADVVDLYQVDVAHWLEVDMTSGRVKPPAQRTGDDS